MAEQQLIVNSKNSYQEEILDLEKKYMEKIYKIINSAEFIKDLELVEDEIRDRYSDYKNIWKLKNKIKIPAERLVYHHIYKAESKEFTINNLYTSAVSSDIGIIVNDEAVLCIDVKTNDLNGNKDDINKIIVERNQNSFDNSGFHELFKVKSNLDTMMRYKPNYPILTYLIKIIYEDNKFKFCLVKDNENYPTIQLACIPNGDLSDLFDYNIISGVKTYTYDLKSKYTLSFESNNEREDFINNKEGIFAIKDFKNAYSYNGITLWKITYGNKKYLAYDRNANTIRLDYEAVKNRYDSNGKCWEGIKKIILK
ncbi:hypothetical protein [Mammaliicoccus fleurettii]|uniref:hypothetical protein n=1 Tax=Mammaliicoccus fleurettii TaxID=150056 RepID=UPI002DB785CE|nr:hypothetical protein [Mammaliicoccus fleurettii]MEB7724078.1 hypothetical protein [Mammaliicoccus fleurettii]